MAWTNPTVEIAFTDLPMVVSPSWTDVTSYVLGDIAIKQGRRNEVDQPAAGTLVVNLDNSGRHFDPSHAGGPFYGLLTQRKRIRVRVGADVLFSGWVQGWPQSLNLMGGVATCTVTAVDALGMLAMAPLAETPYVAMQMRYSPDLYLRCDEEDIKLLLDSSSHDHHGVLAGTPDAEFTIDDPGLPLGQQHALNYGQSFTAGAWGHIIPPVYTGVTQLRYQAMSIWLRINNLDAVPPVFAGGPLFGPKATVSVNDSRPGSSFGKQQLLGFQAAGGNAYTDISGSILQWVLEGAFDGTWHHFYVVVDRTSNLARVYWDGVSLGDQATASNRGLFDTHFTASNYTLLAPGDRRFNQAPYPGGNVSNLAFMQSATDELWDEAGPNLYAAAKGWAGDQESQRVDHVLEAIGWPAGLRTAGYSGGPQPAEASLPANAFAYLASMTRRDGSTVLGMRDGSIKFRNRNALTAESQSVNIQAAFGDDGTFTYRFSDVTPALDDEYVINVISAKRKGGSRTFTIRDRDSIASYFHRLLDLGEVRAVDDTELVGFMGWLLRTYATPRARLRSFTVNARLDATQLAKVTDLWIGDRITLSFTPLGVGSATVFDQWIEGVEHHIDLSAMTWYATYTTAPARITITNPFIVGTSELGPTGTDELGH